MQEFTVGDRRQGHSLVLDASKRSDTIVTVGVAIPRSSEIALLAALHDRLRDSTHTPFRSKSADMALETLPEPVLDGSYPGRCVACVQRGGDSAHLDAMEATQSAVLIDAVRPPPTDTVVIVDGGRDRGRRLLCAADELGVSPPPVATCVRGEQYYPQLMLADMLAAATAEAVGTERPVPADVELLSSEPSRVWSGYNAVRAKTATAQLPEYSQRAAKSVGERIVCWFRGEFGQPNASRPRTDSTASIAEQIKNDGHESLARWVRAQ